MTDEEIIRNAREAYRNGFVHGRRRRLFWLSFCDDRKPVGSRFLGACIVPGQTTEEAVESAWALGCNPGGEVLAVEIPVEAQALVPDDLLLKILDRVACDRIEVLTAAVGLSEAQPPDRL